MSDRIAVMSEGEVQQVGEPRTIYEHPQSRFVADFIGETNFVVGEVRALGEPAQVDIGGMVVLGSADGRSLSIGQKVTLAVRPERLNLYPQMGVPDSLMNEVDGVVQNGRILEAIYIGTDTRYRVALTEKASLFVRVQNFGSRYDTTFQVGDSVFVHWAAENAQILTT